MSAEILDEDSICFVEESLLAEGISGELGQDEESILTFRGV
jgi:hypothetical protein